MTKWDLIEALPFPYKPIGSLDKFYVSLSTEEHMELVLFSNCIVHLILKDGNFVSD